MSGPGRPDPATGPANGRPSHAALDPTTVAAARLWATNRYPYLASAIFAAPVLPAPELGRVVIDRWWRIHADPAVVDGAPVERLGGELIHLTTHLLRDHAARADSVGLTERAELHHWVDAADAEIADDLPTDLERLSPSAAPADLDAATGRLAEEYYRTGSVRDGAEADCGSGAHGVVADWEPPPPSPDEPRGVSDEEQELLRRRVAADVAAAADAPDGLRRWADDLLHPAVDWRAELAAVLRRSLTSVAGAVDYTYRRPSRRAAAVTGVILPALERPQVAVAVVCDTSASVDDHDLGRAVAEIDGLLRATGTRSVTVLACDTEVRATTAATSGRDVALVGGGGTDLAAGLAEAAELRPRPDLVVTVTDGFTPWPATEPPFEVVVALFDPAGGPTPPTPPAWARTVAVGRS